MKLQDQVAIITGGASGMGEATSRLFAREGAQVVIADLNGDKAATLAETIRQEGGRCVGIQVDVMDEGQVRSTAEKVLADFHRIDILINCVGVAKFIPSEDMTYQEFRGVLDANLTGVYLFCREAGKTMLRQKSGRIVNFSSTGGLCGVPYMAAYSAAKHGVIGLTRALAVEWGKYGLRVNCIAPGATATPMLINTTTEAYRAERARRVPSQRLGRPEDEANVALFLSLPESDYINGAVICVDGGMYALSPATSTDALLGKA